MITEPLEPCYPARLRQICLSFAARDVPVSHVHCALCDWQAWIDPIICATTSEPAGMLAAVMAAPAAAMTSSAVAFCAPSLPSRAPSRWRCWTHSSSRTMAAAARQRWRCWRPAAAAGCQGSLAKQRSRQRAAAPPQSATRRARAPCRLTHGAVWLCQRLSGALGGRGGGGRGGRGGGAGATAHYLPALQAGSRAGAVAGLGGDPQTAIYLRKTANI